MLDEWNKLSEEANQGMTPEILAKLKNFVERETERELEEAEKIQWLNSRDQVLSSISPHNTTSQAKESWYSLIEHIRRRLMENNSKIAKILIYSTIWSRYLSIGSFLSFVTTWLILFIK